MLVSDQSWAEIAVAVAALAVLAVAAMVEGVAALVSRSRLRQLAEQRGSLRSVQSLLDPRRSLIAALELVQAIAVAIAASVLTAAFLREAGGLEHLLAVLAVVGVFLVVGQALPRAWAATNPDRAAGALLAIAGMLAFVVRPLTAITDAFTSLWERLLPGAPVGGVAAGTEEELRSAIEVPDDGIIEPEEREMIDNVLQLEDTPVREIMVPRVDIVAVDERSSDQAIIETITNAGHSRVPVYRESIDQIIGVLYAKDLLQFVIGNTAQIPLARLIRPAFVVPESKRIDDLLGELRTNRVHIAIVADEYGGTAGLVTIEDIIEEIVGDIQDEYDVEVPQLELVAPGVIVVDGGIPLDEIEDALGVELQDDDEEVATVAGFVHRHLERLPLEGDRFDADGLHIEVIQVEGHRLRRLRLTKRDIGPDDLGPAVNAEPVTEPISSR
ncbi:MAG TPA: hemolysin family protein [Thermomicrobiales bacterium]|nr:hemolysin family protein [Thermomicrobiales bacterium]